MTRIIGLHGLPGTGKDTVADYLRRTHGFYRMAYADPVKDELAAAFLCRRDLFEQRALKLEGSTSLCLARCTNERFVDWYLSTAAGQMELSVLGAGVYPLPRSPRWMMQTWGTDYRRAQNPLYWLQRLEEKVVALPVDARIVVTDVRYDNEAALLVLLDDDAEMWELVRPNNPHHVKTDKHSSNTRLSLPIQRTILNSGTVNQLQRKAEKIISRLSGKAIDAV